MHGGYKLIERTIKEKFWIPPLPERIKKVLRSCVTCLRWKQMVNQPMMGALPEEQLKPSYPFENIDFAGPFQIRPSRVRFDKVIISLFICLATKARKISGSIRAIV